MHKCIKTQIKTINFYIFQRATIFSCRAAKTLSNNLLVMRITLDEVSRYYSVTLNYLGIAPAGVLATGAAAGALAAGAAAGTVVGIAPAPVTGTGLTTLSITPPPTVVAR